MVLKGILVTCILLIVSFLTYFVVNIFNFQYIPEISDDFCWGKKEACIQDENIYPFQIKVHKEEIHDLILRINTTREFTLSLEDTQNQYGLDGKVIQRILKFIKEDYNFTEREIFLNSYPQFITNIQGLNIHFLHVKSKRRNNLPIVPMLLLHGWPSSVREFYESIPILMSEEYQNKFSIELVIPSLTGFGYSDGSSKAGFRSVHVANVLKILMNRLGYKKFLVHGSDWGAVTVVALATMYPESILGLHSNFCFSLRTVTIAKTILGALWPRIVVEEKYENKMYPLIAGLLRFYMSEGAYYLLMATKPDTIGHILDSTPIGLITYMFEKFSVGKNKNYIYSTTAGLEDFHLTNIIDSMFFYYWFPKKAATAARFYCENSSLPGLLSGLHNTPLNNNIPCACTFFENEFIYQPESFLRDKFPNIVQYNIYPEVGHFAAIEANEVFTKDILSFIFKLYNSNLL